MRAFEDIFGIPEASALSNHGQTLLSVSAAGTQKCQRLHPSPECCPHWVVPGGTQGRGKLWSLLCPSVISPCTAFARVKCRVIPPLLSLCRRRLEIKLGK